MALSSEAYPTLRCVLKGSLSIKELNEKLDRNVMISIPDDKHILAMFFTTLENEGYEVLCAPESQKESDQFQGKNPELIITDDNGKQLMFCRRK